MSIFAFAGLTIRSGRGQTVLAKKFQRIVTGLVRASGDGNRITHKLVMWFQYFVTYKM